MKPTRPYWIVLAALSFAQYASAYCRTTTCKSEDCPIDENGCETSGIKLAWASSHVQVNLQRDLTSSLNKEQTRAALTAAFAQWSNVVCKNGQRASIGVSLGPDVYTAELEYNPNQGNVNTVFFRDHDWPYRGLESTQPSKVAVSFDIKTGEIWDADIAFNTANTRFGVGDAYLEDEAYEGIDFESVALHQAGHFLGLAHSYIEGAVMSSFINPRELRRSLSQDDIDALCEAYPPGRVASVSGVPRGGFDDRAAPDQGEGCTSAGSAPSSAMALIGIMIGSALIRRRRCRKA